MEAPALLSVADLRTHFFTIDGTTRAVDGVGFTQHLDQGRGRRPDLHLVHRLDRVGPLAVTAGPRPLHYHATLHGGWFGRVGDRQ